jgi:Na+-transporting methylmalonyl-CoA/oxaloacetate decarboxylase gamma subunit
MESVPWGFAFQLFGIGLGGVFFCLIILQLSINLFSKIVARIEKLTQQNTGQEMSDLKE